MICPACESDLTPVNVNGFVVDVCRAGCGGIWFDNFELAKVDQPHEALGDALVGLEFNPASVVVTNKRRCPRCVGITLLQHQFSPERPVVVDECPSCGGVWLDGGELAEIRRRVPGMEDRRKAAQRYFTRLFIEDLAQLKARRVERAQPRP